MSHRWILAIFVAAIAACSDRFVPAPLPEGAVPFGAPPIYQTWWAQVEQCSGHRAPFSRVRWFAVPNADSFIAEGRRDNGVWIEHYRYIVLGESRIGDSLVVRHEMLHDLSGNLGHPAEYFRQKCGGVVQPAFE